MEEKKRKKKITVRTKNMQESRPETHRTLNRCFREMRICEETNLDFPSVMSSKTTVPWGTINKLITRCFFVVQSLGEVFNVSLFAELT